MVREVSAQVFEATLMAPNLILDYIADEITAAGLKCHIVPSGMEIVRKLDTQSHTIITSPGIYRSWEKDNAEDP